ncbi:amino acid kinase family-domain containing protein [Nitzschia inconspicua]|uniref:Amino acid kinase family-domain containing protein n=1 Tax=Nitzschia inconspicua TaxID=303405 RepID=A0A9K3LL06_9STRA|nr:amino acid kinase family-domain containing protein [Nitzschia inconspicua]
MSLPSLCFFLCLLLLHFSSWLVEGNPITNPPTLGTTDDNNDRLRRTFDDLEIILVKIGGSSITHKSELERLNSEAVTWFARTVAHATSAFFQHGAVTEKCPSIPDESDHPPKHGRGFVLVHGAGSFGHFTAKEYGLKGHSTPPPLLQSNNTTTLEIQHKRRILNEGLVKTRLSVQKLNQIVVKELIENGVNAVAVSPCFSIPGLHAHASLQAQTHLQSTVQETLEAGLIPVIHGDACLYGAHGAGILSGDTVMEILGIQPWIKHAVFITDVDGVFDRDPRSDPTAQLLSHIAVDPRNGEVVADVTASGSTHEHDVTGGLKTKLKSASAIASAGKNVTIVKSQSLSAERLLQGGIADIGSTLYPLAR